PALTMRDGALTATIWRNEQEQGVFYSVTFSRRYKRSDGNYADANSFSGAELLRLSMLAEQAYRETQALRQAQAAISTSSVGEAVVGAAQ
ncbi:MAG: hypothetical protein ABL962_13905, partial [Fimbriimonadaceae bacterium]